VGIAIADADAARRAAMKARDAKERAIAMIAAAKQNSVRQRRRLRGRAMRRPHTSRRRQHPE
jgi:hypothetical protein